MGDRGRGWCRSAGHGGRCAAGIGSGIVSLDAPVRWRWSLVAPRQISFTPIKGITPAVKEVVGLLEVETSAPALNPPLPHVQIHGCPKGHMPVTGKCAAKRTKVVYFHLSSQCFNNYDKQVLDSVLGKDSEVVERLCYGYSRDTAGRQFPNFGPWNICAEEDLPRIGTEAHIVDPHTARPYFMVWARVSPGLEPEKPCFDVWAEWPDMQNYGEWAVATESETNESQKRGWDGDRGPAQSPLGLGWTGYKRVIQQVETVLPDSAPEKDPARRDVQVRAQAAGRPLRMIVFYRRIDSRAGPSKSLTETGETCAVWEFAKTHTDPRTQEVLTPIEFDMADGSRHDWNIIKELLEPPRDEEGRITGRPRLRVSERCQQTIWALENFTGLGGEAGACKDPVDCLSYLGRGELCHVAAGTLGSRGGGGY